MWLELVLLVMNIQLLLDGLFLESLKVDYTVTSLGKVKRSFITHAHTHRVHTIMGGQGDCHIVFDFFKDRIITPTIIRDFNLHVGYM